MAQKRILILASESPRRRQLLHESGMAFEVLPPHPEVEGSFQHTGSPTELVQQLARAKARDVVHRLSGHRAEPWIVLAADTIAEIDGEIMGKPKDREHAREMLQKLSGRVHEVHTGICLWPSNVDPVTELATTQLRMDELSEEQINAYLDTDKWRGKAGAFGYQDGWDWLHVMSGEESNVVGLPMGLLKRLLPKLDVAIE